MSPIRWHAEAYILALLISLFSGTWPYVKLLAMLVTWFSPSWAITPAWREWVLEWLDTLGKWSLLDCYIMVGNILRRDVFILAMFLWAQQL